MTTRITQVDELQKTVLKVEGPLLLEDAMRLCAICKALREQGEGEIAVDLNGATYINSASAIVLCYMQHQLTVALEGATFFVKRVLELAAKSFVTK